MIDIHQVRIEVQMLVPAHLDCGIGWSVGGRAWREGQLREEAVRRERHAGDGASGELGGGGDEDLLDLGMRGLSPVGSERCHCDGCLGELLGCLANFGADAKSGSGSGIAFGAFVGGFLVSGCYSS